MKKVEPSQEEIERDYFSWNLNPSFSNPLWDSWLSGTMPESPYFKNCSFKKILDTHRMDDVDWHPSDFFKEGFMCKWQGYEQLRAEDPDFLYCVPEIDYANPNRSPRVYCRKNQWLILMVVKEEGALKLKKPHTHLEMLVALHVRFLSLQGQFGSFPGLKGDRLIID